MKFYTGIGARKTPDHILRTMSDLGQLFAGQGWTLRSGAAEGADVAFEEGCDKDGGPKEIFLPWERFNKHPSFLYALNNYGYEIAEEVHPNWSNLTEVSQKFMVRNVHQVIGYTSDINNKTQHFLTNFIVCWTPDGAETANETSVNTGGTGQAIRVASYLDVPVYNLQRPKRLQQLIEYTENLK